MERNRIIIGDCIESMKMLPDACVSMCVTSPPYFALRDYGCDGQIGLEATPEEFIARLVEVFQQVKRILHPTGTAWVNMGDSYAASGKDRTNEQATANSTLQGGLGGQLSILKQQSKIVGGYKPKDLMGIPWRLAFALQADGWYLRSDIIWHKLNPMPESVTDRPTKAHEYLFLFSKSKDYFYDAEAIKEEGFRYAWNAPQFKGGDITRHHGNENGGGGSPSEATGRNRRTVWSIATQPYAEAHFATYPPKLIEPCILAGTSEHGNCPKCMAPWERTTEKVRRATRPGEKTKVEGTNSRFHISRDANHPTEAEGKVRLDGLVTGNRDPQRHVTETTTTGWQPTCKCNESSTVPAIVFDPFGGSGTTAQVARSLGRDYLLCELNPAYADLANKRARTPLYSDAPKQAPSCDGQLSMFTP
jgi:DNA modification methylase